MTTHPSDPLPFEDGFTVLDVTHRQIIFSLGRLSALITRLRQFGADEHARAMATEIVAFFSGVRQHHEDEERHVFPELLASEDPEIVQAVRRLQQDHGWLEEDWRELAPNWTQSLPAKAGTTSTRCKRKQRSSPRCCAITSRWRSRASTRNCASGSAPMNEGRWGARWRRGVGAARGREASAGLVVPGWRTPYARSSRTETSGAAVAPSSDEAPASPR